MINLSSTLLLLFTFFVLIGCDTQVSTPTNAPSTAILPATPDTNTQQNQNLAHFLTAAEKAFIPLAESGEALQKSITDFTSNPSLETLNSAKTALAKAHHHYMLVQVFQNIDLFNPEFDLKQSQPTVIHPLAIRLDQHPVIPGYLDAVPNFPMSGLTFSEQTLSTDFLNNEHQFSDSAYVAIGFHALELMLTGGMNQSPEARVLNFSHLKGEAKKGTPGYRRSLYVQLLTTLIKDDLTRLSNAWGKSEGFYPQTLNQLSQGKSDHLIKQAYSMEEQTLSQLKTLKDDHHDDAIEERKAQLVLFLKDQI